MLYQFAKYLVRLGLFFYCRDIRFSDEKLLKRKGPLMLACNHPNSFLDALILGAFFEQPVHFLARGDAFKYPQLARLLTALKMLPIYRLRDGKEYLDLNEKTFKDSAAILRMGGILLIFSEGLCVNEWNLRPLKKGTARIAMSVWQAISMQDSFAILPVSFNYNTYTSFHKNAIIHFGEEIRYSHVSAVATTSVAMVELNKLIYYQLQFGMVTEDGDASTTRFLLSNADQYTNVGSQLMPLVKKKVKALEGYKEEFSFGSEDRFYPLKDGREVLSVIVVSAFAIPAFMGCIINGIVYYPLAFFIRQKTSGTVFYHSALFGILIIVYPVFWLLACVTVTLNSGVLFGLCLALLLPASLLVYLNWKVEWIRLANYLSCSKAKRLQLQERLSGS